MKEIFKRLGYPKHSGVIYNALSNSKEQLSVSALAEKCGVSRVVVYRCLKMLEANELAVVSSIGRRMFYYAGSAHKLEKAMRCLEQDTQATVKAYVNKREKDTPQYVRFSYGPEGIKAAFDDVIACSKKGDTFFRYTSEQDLAKVNKYLARDYRIRRDKKRLERMVISNATSGSQKKSRLERFIRYIPTEAGGFQQNIIQLMYGDRVCIIDLSTEEVVIIENKQLADFQKSIFRTLYNRLPRQ